MVKRMRLIDAEELKKKAYPFPCAIGTEYAVTLRDIDQAPEIDAVPMDYHERCMQSVIKKKIETEKTNRQILENYVPVAHAHWEQKEEQIGWSDETVAECSACGDSYLLGEFTFDELCDQFKYCPHCGARMEVI